jgi:mono/diheme cytochrome c family protein
MNRTKETCVLPVTALLVVIATALTAKPACAADGDANKIARGKYLVTTSACNDCHTPWHIGPAGPEPDMSRMLSGHPEAMVISQPAPQAAGPWTLAATPTNTAWSGPWGVSFTANLTPDSETGLGKWTQATFMQAIRTGRHMGRGRQILPPMPFAMYRNFTDEDLAAIFAYLRSVPAIRNRVPEPLPPGATAAAAEK